MRYLLLIILNFSALLTLRGQEAIRYDSSDIAPRAFSEEAIKNYKNDRQYQYERSLEPPVSLADRIWNWVANKIARLLNTKNGGPALRNIIAIVAVLVLVFFIIKLTGMNRSGLFDKRNLKEKGYTIGEDDIHLIDFDSDILKAISDGNYRLAIRLSYLQSLKMLADKGRIDWRINKTNTAYLQELKGTDFYPVFAMLTFRFEGSWYGSLPLREDEFRELRSAFDHFNKQVV